MQSYVVEVYFQALSEKIPGAAAIEWQREKIKRLMTTAPVWNSDKLPDSLTISLYFLCLVF